MANLNPTNDGKAEEWEETLRKELNLKYELLGISKQPVGNREQWINDDIETIRSLLSDQRREWGKKIKEMKYDFIKKKRYLKFTHGDETVDTLAQHAYNCGLDDILKEMEKP